MTRLGVIGCGSHARKSHLIPGRNVGFVTVAGYDPSPESRKKVVEAIPGVAFYGSVQALLATNLDAVVIASPDEHHPRQLLLAVQAGKHVLVDKPLATDTGGMRIVEEALTIAEQRGLVVTSCHPRRSPSNPDLPYGWVKENLTGLVEQFGRLIHVGLDFSYHQPSAIWKTNRSLLLDHFMHEIDFLRWLLGDQPFIAHRLTDSYDHYHVAGSMTDKGEEIGFSFLGTRRLNANTYPETIQLRFEHGAVLVSTKTGAVDFTNHETQERWRRAISAMNGDGYDRIFAGVMLSFAQEIRGGKGYLSPQDLLVNNGSAVALAAEGVFHYQP